MRIYFVHVILCCLFSSVIGITIDGTISNGEWNSSALVANFNSQEWYVIWNNNITFGWSGGDPQDYQLGCYFTNNAENNRYGNQIASGPPPDQTRVTNRTLTYPFYVTNRILCDQNMNCTMDDWNGSSWIPGGAAYSVTKQFSLEFTFDASSVKNIDSVTLMFCYLDQGTNSIQYMLSEYGYIGIPFLVTSPGSSWKGYQNTFPAVSSFDGAWSTSQTSVSAWTLTSDPLLSSNNSVSDVDVIVTTQVSQNTASYCRNLMITPTGNLTVGNVLQIGLPVPSSSTPNIPAEVLIQGGLNCTTQDSVLKLTAPLNFVNNASDVTYFKNLELFATYENSSITFSGPIHVNMSLKMYGPVNLIFSEGGVLYDGDLMYYAYAGNYTRGQEWEYTEGSQYGIPQNVMIRANSSVYSNISSDLYVSKDLLVSGSLFLDGNGTLYVATISLNDQSFLYLAHPIQLINTASNINSSKITCKAYGQGQILYPSGVTVMTLALTVDDGTNTELIEGQNQTYKYSPYKKFSVEISENFVNESFWYLDDKLIARNVSKWYFHQSAGLITVTARLSTDNCIRTMKIQFLGPSQGDRNWSAIIGGSVFAAVGIAIIVIAAVLLWRRYKKKKAQKSQEQDSNDVELDLSNSSISVEPKSARSDWQIDYPSITIGKELGRGAFGVVYKCRWRNTDCVVKQLDINTKDEHAVKQFLKEANNVRNLRVHPNVCTILGVCVSPEHPICIVMEFLSQGSLDNLLYNNVITVDAKRLISFGKDVASGMSHLHAENVLHCDLACRNILVDMKGGEYVLKIADFGLSRVTEQSEYSATDKTFPIRWTSPETLRQGTISKGSDIWSFGVVVWEMMEAQQPYPGMSNARVISAVCDEGYRLPKPSRMPNEVYELMLRCWDNTASKRPSFDQIYERLSQLHPSENTNQPTGHNNVYGNAVQNEYQNQ